MDTRLALRAQRSEITAHALYLRLASQEKGKNKTILEGIAKDELKHYNYWKGLTKREATAKPIWHYVLLARIFGLVFLLQYLERRDQRVYKRMDAKLLSPIIADEERHERLMLSLYQDERLEYAGSVVLGLNDALVELTGVLAGLTLALANSRLIVIAGAITGVAASLSMGAAAYFAEKEENSKKSPLKVAAYTSVAYILIVVLLVAPYVVFSSLYLSLAVTMLFALGVVAMYTFYISIAKDLRFWPRFAEMLAVSVTVAIISFALGWVLNHYFGVSA